MRANEGHASIANEPVVRMLDTQGEHHRPGIQASKLSGNSLSDFLFSCFATVLESHEVEPNGFGVKRFQSSPVLLAADTDDIIALGKTASDIPIC
jgi:hypothetical protein